MGGRAVTGRPRASAAFVLAGGLARPLAGAARTLPWRRFRAAALSASALVVVESPAKAATIQRILPADAYTVLSCVGHVRELPSSAKRIPAKYKGEAWSRLGVDVENGFQPLYVLIAGKQKVISQLKSALKEADELILATDEDREGEAISWHLVEVLKPKVPIRRAVFHEITPAAITAGIADGRDININLVQAQETRRILDRLAGYTMSPLLWKKIARGLSAGRVQSVALAVIVKRELERLRFIPADYCDATAVFSAPGGGAKVTFAAALVAVDGRHVARGTDFDPESGKLTEAAAKKGVAVLSRGEVRALMDAMGAARVVDVQKSRARKAPPRPFITSTLQQEGGNKLGMNASRVMRVAQKLYENGHITYMRTDNPGLSEQALAASRAAVEERYGADHLAADAVEAGKGGKKPKAAQAAHEAIRPAGTEFTRPEDMVLEDPDAVKLYSLIYRRTLASQMASAEYDTTSIAIDLDVGDGCETQVAGFRASGRVTVFAGFLRAYEEFDDSAAPSAAISSSQNLPGLATGTELVCESAEAVEHQTKPRARYTDSSLVKELEVLGVGRPSTYASIIEKLVDRTYIFRGNTLGEQKAGVSPRALVPSLTAFAVDELLKTHFPEFVDPGFTAQMEEALDRIAAGCVDGVSYLTEYYLGDDGLAATVERREQDIDDFAFRKISLPNYPGRKASDGELTRATKKMPTKRKSKDDAVAKAEVVTGAEDATTKEIDWREIDVLVGPHGPYLEHHGEVVASLPRTILADELCPRLIQGLVELAKDPVLGEDPETGAPILIKTSKFGAYVQYGRDEDAGDGAKPRRQGLLPGMDVGDLTVDLALKLLNLPRLLGTHPDTRHEIRAGTGPYGQYVMTHDGEQVRYAALNAKEHNVLDIDLGEALRLLTAKEERRKARETAAAAKAAAKSTDGGILGGEDGGEGKVKAPKSKAAAAPKKTAAGAKAKPVARARAKPRAKPAV
jgi:DNA topoisomerase I